jgi:hypothetical protein
MSTVYSCAPFESIRVAGGVGSSDSGRDAIGGHSVFLIHRNKSADGASLADEPLRKMLRRFAFGRVHNAALVGLGPDVWRAELGANGPARRNLVDECGYRLNVAPASGGGVRVVDTWFCGSRECCVCAVRRSNRLLARYGEKVRAAAASGPLFAGTLTVPGSAELRESLGLLMRGLTAFLAGRRRLVGHPLAQCRGGVVSVEVKRGSGGLWHPHAHLLLAASSLDFPALRSYWIRAAPGAVWAWFGRVSGDPFKAAVETLKYSLKRELAAPRDVLHGVAQSKGARFVRSFGLFYGLGSADVEKASAVRSFVWNGSEYDPDSGPLPCPFLVEWGSR